MATAALCDGGDVELLTTSAIIAFDGTIRRGFHVHPDKKHVVYAIGDKIIVQNWYTKEQSSLEGHTNTISAVDLSKTGNYIASGQINYMGFRALVIIWDYHKKIPIEKAELHKARVETLMFSIDDVYLLSVGGRDDSMLTVWDIANRCTVASTQASVGQSGDCYVVRSMNIRKECFITGGDACLRVWNIYHEKRTVAVVDVNCGKLKRVYLSIVCNNRDEYAYAGTTTGDIVKVRLNYHYDVAVKEPTKPPIIMGCYGVYTGSKRPGKEVQLYTGGVKSMVLLPDERLLVGAGDGTVDMVEEREFDAHCKTRGLSNPTAPGFKKLKRTTLFSAVKSMGLLTPKMLIAATVLCEIYSINIDTFEIKMIVTCHNATIFSCAFPYNFSGVFATASKDDVRVWSLESKLELLRIRVPNFYCSGVCFARHGKAIITGWNDGCIRAFTPLSGQLIYTIRDAHNKGVACLAMTGNCQRIVSGGCEGQIRIWAIRAHCQNLEMVLKEHSGPVTAIAINCFDTECASSCTDGTVLIWDLIQLCRKQVLMARTMFSCVQYYPTGVQLITGSADKHIMYWEALDGATVRDIMGSTQGGINCIDLSVDGRLFVSGSNDQIVKLWDYMEGTCSYAGVGHSAVITAVAISPDMKYIISCSASGSIYIWNMPSELSNVAHSEKKEEVKQVIRRVDKAESIENLEACRRDSKEVMNVSCPCICDKSKATACTCHASAEVNKCPSNTEVKKCPSKASSCGKC